MCLSLIFFSGTVVRNCFVAVRHVELRQSPRRFNIPFFICKTMLWYGVVPSAAKRIASQDPPYGEYESHKKAPFLKRLKGVG